MKRISRKKVPAILELTPLIDVVFLLLIFFMVATTFDDLSGFKLKLPNSNSKELKDDKLQKFYSLIIDKDKNMFLTIEKTGENKLKHQLTEDSFIKSLNQFISKEDSITLVADKDLDYGYIVKIITKIKEYGINKINIRTITN